MLEEDVQNEEKRATCREKYRRNDGIQRPDEENQHRDARYAMHRRFLRSRPLQYFRIRWLNFRFHPV